MDTSPYYKKLSGLTILVCASQTSMLNMQHLWSYDTQWHLFKLVQSRFSFENQLRYIFLLHIIYNTLYTKQLFRALFSYNCREGRGLPTFSKAASFPWGTSSTVLAGMCRLTLNFYSVNLAEKHHIQSWFLQEFRQLAPRTRPRGFPANFHEYS